MILPDRRSGHVDIVSSSKYLHVWMGRREKGDVRAGKGAEMGQLIPSMGSERAKFASSYKEPSFQVRGLFIVAINHTHALKIIHMLVILCP